MSNSPSTITIEQLTKLKNHINERFNIFDNEGHIDLDRCQLNVGYALGQYYTNYNGLLLKERQKLADIEGELSLLKVQAYDDIKMTKIKYDVDAKGMALLLEGHDLVRPKQVECDKQKAYVQFLENTLRQIGNYANGVKTILQRTEMKARYGE
jgi:hypothetical protein